SRHGVMFFDDPPRAFAHLRACAAPGASLAFTCFRDRRLNPWASELTALLPADLAAPADPHAPGPFAFADQAWTTGILEQAGWRDVRMEPLDFAYVAGMGDDPVGDAMAFLERIGPAAPALEQLKGTPAEAAVHARLTTWIRGYASDGLVAFPAAAWFVTARRD
ncbi:MAG: SAM-dependent methyltransferase, partial [Burkholderiales bacterium]|nr:SAM-dependent methyltransferase [Burkholderiales bacterium]